MVHFVQGRVGRGRNVIKGQPLAVGRNRYVACYSTCIALWPEFYGSHFNRGLAELRRRDHAAALQDFNRALELRPMWCDHREGRPLDSAGGRLRAGIHGHLGRLESFTAALPSPAEK